jgi:excisionase family DNA binding protein
MITMAKNIPDVFSTHSAARFCRVTPMTIIRWIEEGRIKAYKTPGGHRRIMRADLEDFCRKAGIPMQWEERVDTPEETPRVLIVDDDPSVVDTILDALMDTGNEGLSVETTDNAFDAGRLMSAFKPQFVFLDVGLPGADMVKVAASIRADSATARTRIVAVASEGATVSGPFDDVLRHPITQGAVRTVTGPITGADAFRR